MYCYEDEGKERLVRRLDGGRRETRVKLNKKYEEFASENWSYKGRGVQKILPSMVNVN